MDVHKDREKAEDTRLKLETEFQKNYPEKNPYQDIVFEFEEWARSAEYDLEECAVISTRQGENSEVNRLMAKREGLRMAREKIDNLKKEFIR